MNNYLQRYATFFIFTLALASPQLSYASVEVFPFERLPKDVKGMVFKLVAVDYIKNGKRFGELAPVNKIWKEGLRQAIKQDMQPWQPCWIAYLGVTPANEKIFRTFFNANLECRKDPSDKKPAHRLPFIPLINPSAQALYLPADIGYSKYLVITDNLQRFFQVGGNKDHIIIAIAPKAMIAMRMKSMNMSERLKAKLDGIMTQWDDSIAPICILWRYNWMPDLTRFAYLNTQDLSSISSCSLYENLQKARNHYNVPTKMMLAMSLFRICFEPKIVL